MYIGLTHARYYGHCPKKHLCIVNTSNFSHSFLLAVFRVRPFIGCYKSIRIFIEHPGRYGNIAATLTENTELLSKRRKPNQNKTKQSKSDELETSKNEFEEDNDDFRRIVDVFAMIFAPYLYFCSEWIFVGIFSLHFLHQIVCSLDTWTL